MTTLGASAHRLSPTVVEDLLDRLDVAEERLTLDLRQLDTIERSAGAILSNALVGSLGHRTLEICAGENADELMRSSGLAFALANRVGTTVIHGRSDVSPSAGWAREWRPGQLEPLRAMMRPGDAELFEPSELHETAIEPDLFGPTYAAFVNPHLTQPSLQHHPLTTLLWPWLDRLIPRRQPRPVDTEARALWVADVGRVVDEVLSNVCEHARHSDGRRIHSLVQVSVTRGGGERSTNRLHLCIQDTGPGIPLTARPKIGPAIAAELNETQLVGRLLEGTLSPWGRGRGQGLPRVAEICRRLSGTLRLATKITRATVEGGSTNEAVLLTPAPFRLDGTVVTLTLPVPGL